METLSRDVAREHIVRALIIDRARLKAERQLLDRLKASTAWHKVWNNLQAVKYGLAVLPVLAFLAGCSITRGHEYRLVIDPRFTPDQVEAILAGAGMWEDKVEVRFHEIMDTCPASDWHDVREGIICIAPTEGGDFPDSSKIGPVTLAQTWNESLTDGANVFVSIDRMKSYPTYWRAVMAHELGHAMGLMHNDEAVKDSETGCTLMHSTTSPNQEVTSEDAAAWEAMR